MNDNFVSYEDYENQCYKKAEAMREEMYKKMKMPRNFRKSIWYVVTFGCFVDLVVVVEFGNICAIVTLACIALAYILLVGGYNKGVKLHNNDLMREIDKYYENVKEKTKQYKVTLERELEEKMKVYKDAPVVKECSQRAGVYFRDQISKADRRESTEIIHEHYIIAVGRNRIDMRCDNIIYNGEYICDFDKMRYKELDVMSMGAVAKLIAQNVTDYINKYYTKDISGGTCKAKLNEPNMCENKELRYDRGYYWDSQSYYWLVEIEYEAVNANHKQRV